MYKLPCSSLFSYRDILLLQQPLPLATLNEFPVALAYHASVIQPRYE
ncbi:hypothetical protein RH449_004082 [Providencia stuartii]|nr:hypothetical protein [Providencia stuartii]HEM8345857.1 hypothetical protein [Providencia stuartii]